MHKKIDWKHKLTSRKFWMAIVGVVTSFLVLTNTDAETAEKITALILQLGTLIAYIIGEGLVDAEREENN